PGYISQQEFDDARVALESARARAGSVRAELESARIEVGHAQIRAPIAGRVGRIAIRQGSLVQAGGEPLTTIVAPGALDARAGLAEADWPQVIAARAAGKVMAEVTPDAPGAAARQATAVQGELVFVDTQLDPATGAVPLKVRLAGSPGALMPGQGVRLRLLLGSLADVMVLPEAALQHGQGGTYVYVVRDGRAVVQPVRTTHSLDGQLVVEGELQAGEAVLVEIPKRLKAGGKVTLEGAAAEKKPGEAKP
ncbi:MAG TPA: efflux RND transporter periplasmic adaptor subunit, partial [Thiobacillus sp.]|nr:efflux RND transporter periplasmic adaptor subunit [Thiobacillus sp.]